MHPDLPQVLVQFGLPAGTPLAIVTGGHINLSYRLQGAQRPLLLQRLNPDVFHDGEAVLRNGAWVTTHLRAQVEREGLAAPERRVPAQLTTPAGAPGVRTPDGAWWRLVEWVAAARTVTGVPDATEAREVGLAFGRFLRWMSDYTGPPLVPVLAGFHDTRASWTAFEAALRRDAAERARSIPGDIARAYAARALAEALTPAALPVRIIHGDAKPANVLLDVASGEALAVIDLDTVMPGTLLFDVGDLIRSVACGVPEDDPSPAPGVLREDLFAVLLDGLAAGLQRMPLHPLERQGIVTAGRAITHEQALRFLADHLEGDRYYRITRPGQNLDRARVQLRLGAALAAAEQRLQAIVDDRLRGR